MHDTKTLTKHNILQYAKTEKNEIIFLKILTLYKSKIKQHLHRKKTHNLIRYIIKTRYYKNTFPKESKESLYLLKTYNNINESSILDGIYPERHKIWKKPNRRFLTNGELQLRNFSFIDNPIEALSYFRWLAESECKYALNSCKVHFTDDSINDISTYLLLGSIKPKLFPFLSGGIMNPNIKNIMKPLKLDEYLNIIINKNDKDIDNNIFALPVYSRKGKADTPSDTYKIESRDFITTKVCEQFDVWLAKLSEGTNKLIKLSTFGKSSLAGIIGEILDNAERHANIYTPIDDGIWHITCFMQYEEKANTYKCCLSVFNEGNSIAQSIQSALDMEVLMKLNHYLNIHKNIDKDLLSTVFALQDNSTRTKDESKGGWGLMSMIEFIKKISSDKHGEEPNIVILSGDSYIRFSIPYLNIEIPDNKDRYQWFNKENSPTMPPDDKYVFKLQNKIAGTIITTRFYLNKEALTHE